MIGDRIRHARVYHGWSQSQLGGLVGISQSAVHQIEKTGQVSEDTLRAIADVTGFTEWWFRLGPLPDLPSGSLRYRKLVSASKRDDERLRSHVRQALEALERLSERAQLPPVRLRPIDPLDAIDEDTVEDLATEAREWLGVGAHDPIPSVTRAIERAGIFVIGCPLEIPRHDAVSFWPDFPFGRPIICYSRGYPGDRQRFTIAHELGHLVLHQNRPKLDRSIAETEAHRFSGALLIPRAAALEDIEAPVTLRSLAFVKARWGISIRALIRRCLDLQIISKDRRVSLEKQLAARGWHKTEPVLVPEEDQVLARKLVQMAVGTLSPQRLSGITGLPVMASKELVA